MQQSEYYSKLSEETIQKRIKANKVYNEKKYDVIYLRVPKGEKTHLTAIAKDNNLSLNAFINEAITCYVKTIETQTKVCKNL